VIWVTDVCDCLEQQRILFTPRWKRVSRVEFIFQRGASVIGLKYGVQRLFRVPWAYNIIVHCWNNYIFSFFWYFALNEPLHSYCHSSPNLGMNLVEFGEAGRITASRSLINTQFERYWKSNILVGLILSQVPTKKLEILGFARRNIMFNAPSYALFITVI
jgi:hypothetical protein